MFGYNENELPAVLSAEEERELFLRYKNGDKRAREELIKHNLRMVMGILQNYRRYRLDEEDMASEGVKGLIIAIDKFDIENGNRLYTYAVWFVRREIENFIRKEIKHASVLSLDVETDFGLPGLVERMGASDNPNDTLSCMQALEINEDLKAKINKLKKKEREFIIEYFGLDKPLGAMTLSQKMIGEQKGLSRQRANMIIQNALKKLRKMYESEERR